LDFVFAGAVEDGRRYIDLPGNAPPGGPAQPLVAEPLWEVAGKLREDRGQLHRPAFPGSRFDLLETDHYYAGIGSWKGRAAMKLMETLRKGVGFFLMSIGVSSPAKKPKPKPAPKSES